MLDEIEREFEAARRQSMLDAIEREFEAVTDSFKQLVISLRPKMRGPICKEAKDIKFFQNYSAAATSSLKKLNLEDSTVGDAKRNSMLEARAETQRSSTLEEIEREYEAAASAKAYGKYSQQLQKVHQP
ncbi:hypothetical protein F2Q70_00037205 [Brassica cretica]|uniref:Uncharacterized protein n=1 Tax=Brassica cretica TaxID=69181 RepID=A0A8S9JT02_BRACR|nr:hypothetical protein F2Q70_00037205 [Brassica cretica]